jgi:hypothetical protein
VLTITNKLDACPQIRSQNARFGPLDAAEQKLYVPLALCPASRLRDFTAHSQQEVYLRHSTGHFPIQNLREPTGGRGWHEWG